MARAALAEVGLALVDVAADQAGARCAARRDRAAGGLVDRLFLAGDAASESTTTTAVSWSQVLVGALFVLLAVRTWGKRAPAGEQAEPPKWMAGIDSLSPVKALTLALLLAGVNPKNLLLASGAGAAVAGLALPTTEAVVSLAAVET